MFGAMRIHWICPHQAPRPSTSGLQCPTLPVEMHCIVGLSDCASSRKQINSHAAQTTCLSRKKSVRRECCPYLEQQLLLNNQQLFAKAKHHNGFLTWTKGASAFVVGKVRRKSTLVSPEKNKHAGESSLGQLTRAEIFCSFFC
jgi:hypothetical protein